MSRLPTGQYYPGNSALHHIDARAKLAGFLLLVVAIVATKAVAGYAVICLLTAVIIRASGLPVRVAIGQLGRLWRFLIVIFAMNALFFSAENPVWHWWIFTFSKEGVLQGIRVVASVALVMALSGVFTGTTRPAEITNALDSLLKPLSYIGVPVQDVSMIITVAIRFIPTLMEETDMIRLAQTARGAPFDSKHFSERAKSVLPLVVPIFISAFKRADDLAQAMEARGYRGAKGRTVYKSARLCRTDLFAMLLCAAVCVVQIWAFR